MSVARKWVFPIIWMVIFAVIAGALVKIAFFPDADAAADPEQPWAEIIEPQYQVTTGTVRNDVTLSGTVAQDAPVDIPATLSGEVREVAVANGQSVERGQEILKLRALLFGDDGSPAGTKWMIVTASASGTLTGFTAWVGQQVSVGEVLGKVSRASYHVSGAIPPEQLYRLIDRPSEAQVTINGGPAPFTCTGLSIELPQAGAEGTPSGPVVRCAIPGEVTVFPGLQAELVIAGGIAENVLVVPVTAVEGSAGTGIVHAALPDGSSEPREVVLGLNDGFVVEVIEGLAEGELILEFVPGAINEDPMMDQICYSVPGGGMMCE